MDQELYKTITKLKEADGYIVLISAIKGKVISHGAYARKFPTSDVAPSIDHVRETLMKKINEEGKTSK